LETCLFEPLELIVESIRKIHHPVDLDLLVCRILGDDHIGEDEPAARPEGFRHPPEEFAFTRCIEMVDDERGVDEVERPFRQLVLEPCEAEVGLREGDARAV
jgi:hypothetical protein